MWIFAITRNSFVGEKILKNIKYCFIEKTDLIMNIFILKKFIQIKFMLAFFEMSN